MVLICVVGLISGRLNENSIFLTTLGTFDYVKNFLVIFIYAAFFNDPDHLRQIFRALLFIALLIGTIALIQFIWAMGSVYIFGKDISDPGIYILSAGSPLHTESLETIWRYGIFRTPSLTYHAFISGLFNLLILTVYIHTEKRKNITILILLISAIIASVSRMAYTGLIFIFSIALIKKYKRIVPMLVMITIITAFFAYSNDYMSANINNSPRQIKFVDDNPEKTRPYTRGKSHEIWKDHPLWGVGPGKFGGVVASKFRSYIYEKYNVSNQAYIHSVGGIEQFWFQILAEMGIIGALCFINLIAILFMTLSQLRSRSISQEIKGLFSALIVFIGCILLYSFGSGINIAPVLFTYCAFIGIGWGSFNDQLTNKKSGVQ